MRCGERTHSTREGLPERGRAGVTGQTVPLGPLPEGRVPSRVLLREGRGLTLDTHENLFWHKTHIAMSFTL